MSSLFGVKANKVNLKRHAYCIVQPVYLIAFILIVILALVAKLLRRQENVVRNNKTLFSKVRQADHKSANINPYTIFARAEGSRRYSFNEF
jgi:hypothetical protein